MAHAICFECGTPKRHWGDKCPQCSLDPRRDHEALVKSAILSDKLYDDGADPDEQTVLPKFDEAQLDAIGKRIRAGEPYEFDEQIVSYYAEWLGALKQLTWKHYLSAFLRACWKTWPWWMGLAIMICLLKYLRE